MQFDLTFWFAAFLATFSIGIAKSGFIGAIGMVAVPVMALVMPTREAAGMILPVLLAMDAFAIWSYRKDFNPTILKIMLPGAMVGILLGWLGSNYVSDDLVMLVLGIITMLFVVDALLPWKSRLASPNQSAKSGSFWGAVSGFTSFVSHAGGPPYQIYTVPKKMEPRLFAGTGAWFFTILNLVKLIPYYFLGQISFSSLQLSVLFIPPAFGFLLLGVWLTRRISGKLFYRITYVGIFCVAAKLIYDGTTALFLQ